MRRHHDERRANDSIAEDCPSKDQYRQAKLKHTLAQCPPRPMESISVIEIAIKRRLSLRLDIRTSHQNCMFSHTLSHAGLLLDPCTLANRMRLGLDHRESADQDIATNFQG